MRPWEAAGGSGRPRRLLGVAEGPGESGEDAHDLRASPLPATCRRSGRGGAIYGTSVISRGLWCGAACARLRMNMELGGGSSPSCKWINERP